MNTDVGPSRHPSIESFYTEGEIRGFERWKAHGAAAALLAVLDERGISVSDWGAARINACIDPDVLLTWARRAVNGQSLNEILADQLPDSDRTPTADGCCYRSGFARRHYLDGYASGLTKVLLALLKERDIDLSPRQLRCIMGTTDTDQINTWIDRAVTADSLDEIFAQHPKP
ncbi:hypothetical protein [Nocardia sp. Marseille-Q1738]